MDFRIKLFADGAKLEEMIRLAMDPRVAGFTTNPSLMRSAGVKDYETFAKSVLAAIPNKPISFEVFSDEQREMVKQAEIISRWGKNVYVKIPVCDTHGRINRLAIDECVKRGIKVNVTAVFVTSQVSAITPFLDPAVPSIVSIFAGRIADTGVSPSGIIRAARTLLFGTKAETLWASTRELYNIIKAEEMGVDIITVSPALLKKLSLLGKDLLAYSQETVQEFYLDASAAHYEIRAHAEADTVS